VLSLKEAYLAGSINTEVTVVVSRMLSPTLLKRNKPDDSNDVEMFNNDKTDSSARLVEIKLTPAMTIEEINEKYKEGANFIANNVHIHENGHEMLNNLGHVKQKGVKYWENPLYGPFEIVTKCAGSKILYNCPLDHCDVQMPMFPLSTTHLARHHGHEKYMCPIGFPSHVVPIVCIEKDSMINHITDYHKLQGIEPILIHTKQLSFPFTLLAQTSLNKLLFAELCFSKERIEAYNIIKQKRIIETGSSKWISLEDLPIDKKNALKQELHLKFGVKKAQELQK